MGHSATTSVAMDSRRLVSFCDELHERGIWQKLAQTWDEFCETIFEQPARYIELIRVGVHLLDNGDDTPIPADKALKAAQTMRNAPKAKAAHRPSADKVDNINLKRNTGGGTSKTYLAAVLKRDHPDIAAAVEQGKYRSIRAAALDAGIVKKTLTVPNDPERAARSIVNNFGREFADELIRYLAKK